jgi:hypothetical protein
MNTDERLCRWRVAIHRALTPIERQLIVPARDLAVFDAELLEADQRESGHDILEWVRWHDDKPRRFGLSRLWVLGAYELVRMLEQHLREEERGSKIHEQSHTLKRQFERLRIPLAKFEPPRLHSENWSIATPGESATGAVGWRINAEEFIERRMLGDALLGFLEQLAEANRQRGAER